MDARFNIGKHATGAYQAMAALEVYLRQSGLEESLLHLIKFRASQINGCAYCIDMHWKDLRAAGVGEQKLYMLDAWREWHEYTDRERAALEWTEAVTRLHDGEVSDRVYEVARAQFDDAELAKLTLAVCAINSWNRLNIAFRTKAGSYQPKTL